MISLCNKPLVIKRANIRRKRNIATFAKIRDYPKFAEAVNGRAAMYGMVFGSTNWALFDMNIIDQLYYPPTAFMTVLTSVIVIASLGDAANKVSEETFERYASRDYGRIAMTVMALMILVSAQ